MLKSFTIILQIGISTILCGQNSVALSGGDHIIGDIVPFELEDGTPMLVRTLGIHDMYLQYKHLQLISLDECGPTDNWTITSDEIRSISNIFRVVIKGDDLYIILEVYPNAVHHNSTEIGLLKVSLKNRSTEYIALRTSNTMRNLDFKILDNGNYMLYNFISYTDIEPAYCIYILNPQFEFIDYFEFNYNYYSITGNCKQISDGWICSHGFTLFRLDQNLDPVWTIETKDRNTYWQMELEEDGIVVRTSRYVNFIRQMTLVRFDYNGNLIWRSPNLAKLDFTTSVSTSSKLLKRQDKNYDMLVSYNDYTNKIGKLFYYRIDHQNGNILAQEEIVPTNLPETFVFKNYFKTKDNTFEILLADYDNNHHIIRYSDSNSDCVEITSKDITNSPNDIIFTKIQNPVQREINYKSGTYPWFFTELPLDYGITCKHFYKFQSQLPDDTISCQELGLAIDLTSIDLSITWNDGDTQKIRTFNEPGNYSYMTSYCDQEYQEEVNLTLKKCACDFEIANIFSPNGDDLNDEIKLNNQCDYLTDFQFLVYDRSGSLLFQTKAPEFSWDGKFNGQKLNNGVYTYVMQYKNSLQNNKLIQKSGTITIAK